MLLRISPDSDNPSYIIPMTSVVKWLEHRALKHKALTSGSNLALVALNYERKFASLLAEDWWSFL